MSERISVGAVVRHLDERFPFAWAEPWDRVGLLVGDPDCVVERIFVTLDPTLEALSSASANGANVLATHHPAFLEPPARLTPAASAVAFRAASMGIALVACHTNLDRAPAGGDALANALGLDIAGPLERGRQDVALVTVYCPEAVAEAVLAAMTAAGAGRVGEYRGCAFSAAGTGTFIPGTRSRPWAGGAGERSSVAEVRLEMVCDRGAVGRVTAAARSVHPYEEPLIVVEDSSIERGAARLGRLCRLPHARTLRSLAEDVAAAFSITPRVWGDAASEHSVVATFGGSGGSALREALAQGASVLLTGEVRYHEALEALSSGLAVIEAGHDVTEWPLVPVLAEALRAHPAMTDSVVVDDVARRWWTP
jgi:dinuclear metal center YbgI/SA1388 family protein